METRGLIAQIHRRRQRIDCVPVRAAQTAEQPDILDGDRALRGDDPQDIAVGARKRRTGPRRRQDAYDVARQLQRD